MFLTFREALETKPGTCVPRAHRPQAKTEHLEVILCVLRRFVEKKLLERVTQGVACMVGLAIATL